MENLLGVAIKLLDDADEVVSFPAFTVSTDVVTLEFRPVLVVDTDYTATVPAVATYTAGVFASAEALDATHPFADPDTLIVSDAIYDDATAQAWAASENIKFLKVGHLRVLPYAVAQRVSGSFGLGTVTSLDADAVEVLADDGETYVLETTGLTLT